jgi:hypothetical protein
MNSFRTTGYENSNGNVISGTVAQKNRMFITDEPKKKNVPFKATGDGWHICFFRSLTTQFMSVMTNVGDTLRPALPGDQLRPALPGDQLRPALPGDQLRPALPGDQLDDQWPIWTLINFIERGTVPALVATACGSHRPAYI